MKNIRYTLGIMLGACLMLNGCQELTEHDKNSIPTVVTGETQDITAHSATIMGRCSQDKQVHFLLSSSADLSDAEYLSAIRNNSLGNYDLYQVNVNDLERNSTYYYALCASDGISEVRGEVKSFTTLNNYKIGKITYTDWDSTVKELTNEYSPIGITLVGNSGDIYHNLKTTLDESEWKLSQEIPAGTVSSIYAYCPYSDDYEQTDLGRVCFYKYYYDNDCLYAQTNAHENGSTIDLNFQHVMARIIFHFSIGKNNQNDKVGISSFTISNGDKILPTTGKLIFGEEGYIYPYSNAFDSPLYYGNSFELQKGNTYDVTIYSIPTTDKGIVKMTLQSSDSSTVTADLEISGWEKGKTYEYNIIYEHSSIVIADTTVEDWNNNKGGDITVND